MFQSFQRTLGGFLVDSSAFAPEVCKKVCQEKERFSETLYNIKVHRTENHESIQTETE